MIQYRKKACTMLLKRFIYVLILITSFVSIAQATSSICLERFGGTLVSDNLLIERLADTVWMPNSTCFATVAGTQLRIYDIEFPDESVVLAESEEPSLQSVAFSSDGNVIAYNIGGTLYRQNTSGSTIVTETGYTHILNIEFAADNEYIAIATANYVLGEYWGLVDDTLQLINASGTIENTLAVELSPIYLSFTSDNHLLVYSIRAGYAGSDSLHYYTVPSLDIVWETQNLREIIDTNPSDDIPFESWFIYTNIANNGNDLVLSSIYGYLDYDDYLGTLFQIWDVDKPTLLNRVVVSDYGASNPSRDIVRIAISPDSSTVATSLHDNTMVLWDWQDATQTMEFQTDFQQIFGLSFNPTLSDYLMIYGLDTDNQYSIQVWNLASVEWFIVCSFDLIPQPLLQLEKGSKA
jgi:WD40 repeat protein